MFRIMIHASCAEHDNEGVADAALAGTLSGSSGWLCRAVSPRVMQLQGAVNTIPVKTCWSLEKARLYIIFRKGPAVEMKMSPAL